jgi:Protein of unknown function (DUF3562)
MPHPVDTGICFTLRELPIMINDSMDSQIIKREQWAIELLARKTHTAIAKVQKIFVIEYAKLAMGAQITSFLPLLASKRVKAILDEQNAETAPETNCASPRDLPPY